MTLEEVQKLIDSHIDSYPDMTWLQQVIEFFSKNFSLIPLNQGVYQGNTDGEIESERLDKDLKGTNLKGWEKYSIEKSQLIPRGDKYGIVCGPYDNQNGIIVLDVDNPEEFNVFCKTNNITIATQTFKVASRENRYHLYYKYPYDGNEYKSRKKGKENCGFDVRAKGGYVLGPGSINPITKKPYRIFDTNDIAPCPEWLKQWCLKREIPTSATTVEILPPTNTQNANVILKQETRDLLATPGPYDYKSETIVFTAMCQMLRQGCPENQILFEIMASQLGEVVKIKGMDWYERTLNKCKEYANKKSKDMSNELYNTMTELEYFRYNPDDEYYAKIYKSNGKIAFYNIDSDKFDGYILNIQGTRTDSIGNPNNLKMAKLRLKAYIEDHSRLIDKISRFGTINNTLIYNTGFEDKFIAVTQNGYTYIPHPELVVKEESDIMPVDEITMDAKGLSETGEMLDLLDIHDLDDKLYITIFLVSILFSKVSKPIILFVGPGQSGKTQLASSLKAVWDPVRDEEKGGATLPEKIQDLAVLLNSQSIVLIDNFSDLTRSIQNTLCSAFSKGFFPVRKQYTNKGLVKIPLNAPILMTTIEITNNLRSDLESRMNFFAMHPRKTFLSEAIITDNLNKLYPIVRGELFALAVKILPLMSKYKPVGLKRYADFEIIGQAFFEVIGDDNPKESFIKLMKDRIKKDSYALLDQDVIIREFVDYVYSNNNCITFTMSELLEQLSSRLPESIISKKNDASLGVYINSKIDFLTTQGIFLFSGGKRDYGRIYLAGTEEKLKELFGDDALDKLRNDNSIIKKAYDDSKTNQVIDSML